MKRFVTYLYEYENGHKKKNAGFLRVDIRNQRITMLVSIRHPELREEEGRFYIIVRDKKVYGICLGNIQMKDGEYNGTLNCGYHGLGESPYSLSDAIGIIVRYKSGSYLASSWRDDADERIAEGNYEEYGANGSSDEISDEEIALTEKMIAVEVEQTPELAVENAGEHETYMEAAAISRERESSCGMIEDEERTCDTTWEEEPTCCTTWEKEPTCDTAREKDTSCDFICDKEMNQESYKKINLHEIATLPSSNWYFSNNSFLIHGFWNYGYLVLKETFAAGEKKLYLGVPGIFEQPEMVMASYFGFPTFEALPSQVVEMVIGETYQADEKEKNQEPKVGIFGCWFANL